MKPLLLVILIFTASLACADDVPLAETGVIRISVTGLVATPGAYEVPADADLATVIAKAGGTYPEKWISEVRITRKIGDQKRGYAFRYRDLGSKEAKEFRLKEGDSVYVARRYTVG